jgi:phenylpropionate dioxygenase-like ring-hydroxylating dioxygenase large terminal subunit
VQCGPVRRETQLEILREIFHALDAGAPPMSDGFTRNDVRIYTSGAHAAREDERVFRGQPLVAGLSAELANPGDYVTESLSPVPILVVRQASGALRAFANACRHRGSRVVDGCGSAPRGFTCPYHAWSYAIDGRLTDVPDAFGFPGLERDRYGLVELPASEAHGLVWVVARPDAVCAIADHVGGLASDLASYAIDRHRPFATRILHRRMNWKLAADTFWEAYHLKVLHRRTIARLFVRNLGIFHPFGRCHRFVGVRTSIETLRGRPEADWELLPHATVLMSLFPNSVLIMQSDHLELFRIFPVAGRVNECMVRITLLVPEAEAGAEHAARWTETMELLLGVLDEDFTNGEAIQRNFEAGFPDHVVYGRFEQPLEHFHRSLRDVLGSEPPAFG